MDSGKNGASWRVSLAILIFTITVFASISSVQAGWNPVKDIGKAVGSVFRGVGGVFGQGLAGFAQPTITETANAIQRVADDTLAKAEATGGRLIDKIVNDTNLAAEARIKQVSAVVTTQIEDVDKRVREHLAKVDEILALKLGSADIIATRQINNVELALTAVIRYASVIALITAALAILFYFAASRWRPNVNIETLGPGLAYGVVLAGVFSAIAFGASWFLRPPSENRMDLIAEQLVASFKDSIQTDDFDSAVFFASQYSSLDAAKLAPRFLVQFADLQRDLRKRSALFTSESGSRELFARVAQISKTWEVVSNDLDPKLTFLRYEVPATAAMIAWQNSLTVSEQLRAGCAAAGALYEFGRLVPEPANRLAQASGYVWLSASYLHWLLETDPAWVAENRGQLCNATVPAATFPNDWMAQSIAVAQGFTANEGGAPPAIEAIFKYNILSAGFYKDVVRLYGNAVISDNQYRAYSKKEQIDAAKLLRNEALAAIGTRWVEYSQQLNAMPGLDKKDIVLSMAGLPLGIIARQQLMPGSDRPEPTADAPSIVPPAPDRLGVGDLAGCRQLFDAVATLYEPVTFEALCINQQVVDAQLRTFEKDLQVAFAPDNEIELRLRELAKTYKTNASDMLSLTTNMVGCIEYVDSMWVPCTTPGAKTSRFIDWLATPKNAAVPAGVSDGALRVAMAR